MVGHVAGRTPFGKTEDLAGYESLLCSRVVPEFGNMELRRISTASVRSWVASMVEEGLSAARIRQALQVLHASLDVTVDDGLIARNPTDWVKVPRVEKRRQLGVSLRVPSSWVEAVPRSGFDFVVEDPTEDGGFVLATRVLAVGEHYEFGEMRQEELVRSGATIYSVDASTINGHPTHVFRYELEEPGAVLDTEYVIDAGDGTYILIVVGERRPGRNSDLLEWIGSTITIADLAMPVDVEPVSLDKAGFVGSFVVPPGGERQPAVLLLGGSEGGMPGGGVQLARAGFPTLSLAYHKAPGLPDQLAEIPLEYFEDALQWLADRPEVDPERIFIWGTSRGGEAALLIASTYPDLVHGVVANVPANVAVRAYPPQEKSAWTLGGEPIPYARTMSRLTAPSAPEAEIAVERIDGPILLTCGEEDTVWASCPMANAIIDRLKRLGHSFPNELLEYPELGHFVNRPPPWGAPDMRNGGDHAWRASLAFLDDNS